MTLATWVCWSVRSCVLGDRAELGWQYDVGLSANGPCGAPCLQLLTLKLQGNYMPRDVYKVTSATIEKAAKGYELFALQLDGSIRATQLIPTRRTDQAFDKIYQIYSSNGLQLTVLVGKYLSLRLEETRYGFQFSSVGSCDAIADFKLLLDRSGGKAFHTDLNIVKVLSRNGYQANPDGSITLRGAYSNFNAIRKNETVICYPNRVDHTFLTMDNMEAIYDRFYRDKEVETLNPDRISEYAMHPSGIVEFRQRYHKDNGKLLSKDYISVLSLGDRLTQEQLEYLAYIHEY